MYTVIEINTLGDSEISKQTQGNARSSDQNTTHLILKRVRCLRGWFTLKMAKNTIFRDSL